MMRTIIRLFFLLKPKHAQDFTEPPEVDGTIALDTKDVKKIQGVQLLGGNYRIKRR